MSQAPTKNTDCIPAHGALRLTAHRTSGIALGVACAMLLAPAVSKAKPKKRNDATANLLGEAIQKQEQHGKSHANVHPFRGRSTGQSTKQKTPKEGGAQVIDLSKERAHRRPKQTNQGKAPPKGKTPVRNPNRQRAKKQANLARLKQEAARAGYWDTGFTVRTWNLLKLTHHENLVRSFSPKEWTAYVEALQIAGKTAYNEFQKSKSEVALKLLEGIQKSLELAAEHHKQAGGKVTPLPAELPPELRKAVEDNYRYQEAA